MLLFDERIEVYLDACEHDHHVRALADRVRHLESEPRELTQPHLARRHLVDRDQQAGGTALRGEFGGQCDEIPAEERFDLPMTIHVLPLGIELPDTEAGQTPSSFVAQFREQCGDSGLHDSVA